MHPLGKVLLVFAIIGSGCAIYFSGKMLDQKQAWMKKAEDREKELAEITAKNKASQLLKETREAELNRLMLGWDRYWNNIQLNVAKLENAPPTIAIGVGNDKRIVEKQRVYVFATGPAGDGAAAPAEGATAPAEGATSPAEGAAPATPVAKPTAPAGASRFLGTFTVNAVDATRSALGVDGRPTPEQIDALESSKSTRVRTLIPSEREQPFTALQKNVLTMDERIAETQAELKVQQLRLEGAQAEQKAREREIEGNPDLRGKTLPAEVIEGLVATLAVEEEQRNSALELVKSLQTRLKDTVERVAAIRGEIDQLVRSLPQPSSQQARRELSPR